jgi:hypothetical protein
MSVQSIWESVECDAWSRGLDYENYLEWHKRTGCSASVLPGWAYSRLQDLLHEVMVEDMNNMMEFGRDPEDVDDEDLDGYGNPIDGSEIINCCFPDCGCDGARLCQARKGASSVAYSFNVEWGSL